MEDKEKIVELENKLSEVQAELDAKKQELEDVSSQLSTANEELESLRTFKEEAEEKERRSKVLADRSAKLAEIGVDVSDAEKLIDMTDTAFEVMLTTLSDVKKASAAKKEDDEVPPNLTGSAGDSDSLLETIREGLKDRKARKSS